MYNAKILMTELENEIPVTRKMLELVPTDKYDWKPHPKSMSLRQLATHIAELPSWVSLALTTEELDFAATPYTPHPVSSTADLLSYFEKNVEGARALLPGTSEEKLNEKWVLREGDNIYVDTTKGNMIRVSLNQIIHHRAQLGVFLRLLDIPIPGSYGPSADEMGF
jgi:uncharacterized damage-inducible protein DinB